jgi:glutamate formiminotransferase
MTASPSMTRHAVVGARPFLIAYNINLRSSDVEIAKRIARQIRESSGGLPAVQAKGFLVEGLAQVSMNLLDTDATPLHVVYERVAALAAEEGVEVASSELVGLAPQRVLLQAAAHFLKLEPTTIERTIEAAMRRAKGGQSI